MKFFDLSYFIGCFSKLMPYLPLTLMILLIAMAITIPLSAFLAWRNLQGNAAERGLIRLYIQVIRGAPFIVMLFVVYFGIPKLMLALFGIDINGWNKASYIIITMVLFQSARMSEAMRAAYLAVPRGQMEAVYSCGMTGLQGFLHVMLPQTVLVVLPNLGNLVLSSLLETAVGFSVGIIDFVGNARMVTSRDYGLHTLEIYLAVALVYWALAVLLARLFGLLEGALARRQGRTLSGRSSERKGRRAARV
ncbi:MAG: amino acid ABC transporter permease [Oscillibacter sp.]|nr:amino acid ABC transporter permease [Oscillibacter sp.]